MSKSAAVAEPEVESPPSVKEDRQTKTQTRPKHQPPYAVIVENDDVHTYAYVIEALCRTCGHSPEKAFQLADQIHRNGRAAVWTGMLEVAELKRDQIRGAGPDFYAEQTVRFPLGVTVEPMPAGGGD